MASRLPGKKFDALYLIFSLLGGVVLLFVLAPLLGMILQSSLKDLAHTAVDLEVQKSIGLTLWTSMAATLFFALFAIPLAYLLARKEFPFKRLIMGIIDLPMVIPHSAAGIALLTVLSRQGPLGNLGIRFVGRAAGIMAAMAFVSLPYLINAARLGFQEVPRRLEKAAMNLGAGSARVFFTISLPLAYRSILSGLVLMWARGMSEFGAVVIIAYHPMITPVMIYERFNVFGIKYALPVAILFIAISLIFFVIIRLLARNK